MEPKPWGLPGCMASLRNSTPLPGSSSSPAVRQRLLDDVVRPDAHAAGGDHQVGAHQLVLDGVPQGRGVVGDGAHPVGDRARVPRGGGEGEAVGVVDLPRAQFPVGLDEFAAGGEHHHARARAHAHRAAADRGEQGDLRRAEDGAGRQGPVAGPDVAALGAHVRACPGRAVHVHLPGGALGGEAAGAHPGDRALAEAAVGPLDGDDGLGAGRERGAGHDAGGLAGADVEEAGRARGDVPDDLEGRRVPLARARDVRDPHRVPVHGAVVERGQGDRHRDVLDQDAALGVEEVQLDGFEGPDGREDVVQVLVHRPEAVRTCGAGRDGAQRCCISSVTYRWSQVRKSGPRSSRSHASRTMARR
ncbi:hypothetical protein GCM10023238_15310 [Streptomyces heliomycini]